MKRPTMLIQAMMQQASIDLDLSVERDVSTLTRRFKHEGLSFLTITLPVLSDALERGIEDGRLSCPTNFSRQGRLPRLLGGFFRRVFDEDGKLRQDACPESIYWIRQICRFFKKLKIECSPERNAQAITNYLSVEGELRQRTSEVERNDNVLDLISRILWAQVLPEPDPLGLVPRHGPGVTAELRRSNERYRIIQWDDRAEQTFPSDLFCYPSYEYAERASREGPDSVTQLRYNSVAGEPGVRVVFVPKTLTAPRVIAIEPSHKQYMQQALLTYIVDRLESHKLTRRSLRFSDQRPNQRLAYRSSIDRRLSTLDLKDASDRVHLHLVQRIFKDSGILQYLEDSRSLHATLPDGKNVVLWKFASMGSALCFPVEAMVFYTIILSAMHKLDSRRPTLRSIGKYSKLIDIYGDDIIVPVEYTDVVVRELESYCLKVNVNKSFRQSLFRESCGADYYNGHWVKPVYARQLAPDDARDWDPSQIMAWVSTSNQFYELGKWHLCQAIRDMVTQVVGRPIPRCRSFGAGLFFFSHLYTTGLRYDSKLHCWRQKRIIYYPVKRKDSIDGDPIACFNRLWLTKPEVANYARAHPGISWGERQIHNPCRSESKKLDGHERPVESGPIPVLLENLSRDWDESSHRSYSFLEADRGHDPQARSTALGRGESPLGLDFHASTYRGRYKSKCRWTSISY